MYANHIVYYIYIYINVCILYIYIFQKNIINMIDPLLCFFG